MQNPRAGNPENEGVDMDSHNDNSPSFPQRNPANQGSSPAHPGNYFDSTPMFFPDWPGLEDSVPPDPPTQLANVIKARLAAIQDPQGNQSPTELNNLKKILTFKTTTTQQDLVKIIINGTLNTQQVTELREIIINDKPLHTQITTNEFFQGLKNALKILPPIERLTGPTASSAAASTPASAAYGLPPMNLQTPYGQATAPTVYPPGTQATLHGAAGGDYPPSQDRPAQGGGRGSGHGG